MSGRQILIVDDESQIRRVLRTTLASRGYELTEARTGEEAIERVRGATFDLVLLDIHMPGMGGIRACRQIRDVSDAAIIMVTVRNAESDKVSALDAGADDYVTKPFSMPELLARIRAALRRTVPADDMPSRVFHGELEIDFAARCARVQGREAHLTPKELDLLTYFIGHANHAVSHRELLHAVWGPEYGEELEYLRVFVNQLRRKIEPEPAKPRYLLTDPRFGYRFQTPEPSS